MAVADKIVIGRFIRAAPRLVAVCKECEKEGKVKSDEYEWEMNLKDVVSLTEDEWKEELEELKKEEWSEERTCRQGHRVTLTAEDFKVRFVQRPDERLVD